jgi:hypothetical protein
MDEPLRVDGVPQDRKREATVSDCALGRVMVGQPTFTDEIGSEPTDVEESANLRRPRCVDDILVLPHPLVVFIGCGNEQQLVGAIECLAECVASS